VTKDVAEATEADFIFMGFSATSEKDKAVEAVRGTGIFCMRVVN
jgi:hypothetical protein